MESQFRKILKIESGVEHPNYFQILRVSRQATTSQIRDHYQQQIQSVDQSILSLEEKNWLRNLLATAQETLTDSYQHNQYVQRLEKEEKEAIANGIQLFGVKGYIVDTEFSYISKKFPNITKYPELSSQLNHLHNYHHKFTIRQLFSLPFLIICLQAIFIAFLLQPTNIDHQTQKVFSNFVVIPKGHFVMGRDQGNLEERPRRKVFLPDFQMLSYEVTNLEYQIFVQETQHPVPYGKSAEARPWSWNPLTRSYPPGKGHYPVVLVSWEDAVAYCRWYSEKYNCHATLPTESEWEKAARGFAGLLYPWGNQVKMKNVSLLGNFEGEKDFFSSLAPVKHFPAGASPFEIYDLAGNVAEWCLDSWKEKDAPLKVLRGGDWNESIYQNRSTMRRGANKESRSIRWGFRIVIR